MVRPLLIAPIMALAAIPLYCFLHCGPPPLPDLPLDEWWGPPETKGKASEAIKPFKIEFKEDMIQDLKRRITSLRSPPPPLEGVRHEYGFNSNQLQDWLKYWAQEYNFAERQKFFNQYKHYKTNIQGLNIHFIHVTPKVPANVVLVPILMMHGWPGSIREFYEAIPLLTAYREGQDFALELIVPSLPGYGFSDAAVRPGLGAPQAAVVFRNLMHRLGFKRFYIQGGDFGSFIGTSIATLFPEAVLGYHTNMPAVYTLKTLLIHAIGSLFPSLVADANLAEKMYPLGKFYSFMLEETGYMHIQATKPDTVGVSVSDSPAGLLAYIFEKFPTATDRNQKPLTQLFTIEQLIDNLMCYWSTNSMTTAMRLYAETLNKKQMGYKLMDIPTPVPTWVAQAKYELGHMPPFMLRMKFPNLVNVTVLDTGGHFLALEMPKEFSEDVIRAVAEFRKIKKTKTEL